MLGKLKQVDLREQWKTEAGDFTKWLAGEENMALLSDEIGIDIKLIQTEASVGKFNVDILAEEETTGKKIIIENQLEATNHTHLGQIITYASGHEASYIIWIVKDVRDEHKQAVDWLNEHTDEDINFFIVKMELWQIDSSAYAPKFQIVSKPNEWAKAVKQLSGKSQLTDTKVTQLEFWNKFKEYAQGTKTALRLRKAHPQHWYDISIGTSGAHVALTINTQAKQLACELYIPDSKELFHKLSEHKDNIEPELGQKPEWMELPGKKAARIKLSKEGDIDQPDHWEEYFKWFKTTAENFQKVFLKYIKKVRSEHGMV